MDQGHFNCRDYYISPHFAPTTITNDHLRSPSFTRHESFHELEHRARSPASFKPKFPLLRLPLELRQQIFRYLLPKTRELRDSNPLGNHARNFSAVKKREARGMIPARVTSSAERGDVQNVVWQRGDIGLLSVCKQLHDECAEYIYGNNTFLLFVTYEGITFRFRWELPSGLAPSRSYPFLELLPKRYQLLLKRVVVNVDHVDSYTGMIKFNISGKGLAHGLRKQLVKLVQALEASAPASEYQIDDMTNERQLTKLAVRVSNGNAVLDAIKSDIVRQREGGLMVSEDLEEMLEPLNRLYGVRDASVTGAVTDSFARRLEERMRSTEKPCEEHHVRQDSRPETEIRLCVDGNDI